MICSKCKKKIPAGKGCYNRPDGIICVKCNDRNPYVMKDNVYESLELVKKIFKL